MSDTAIRLWDVASIVLLIVGVVILPLSFDFAVIGLACEVMAVFCLKVHEDAVYLRELEELKKLPPPPPPVMDC